MGKQVISIIFLLALSSVVKSQTYTGSGGVIPDDGPAVEFTLEVDGLLPATLNNNYGLLTVCLDITHTYCADLHAWIISPDGTIVGLFSSVGGGDDNFSNTCFDSNSSLPIGSANAPFTGSYIPIDNLGEINNQQDGNGEWKLRILDNWAQDIGTLNSWSITFGEDAVTPITVDSTYLPIILIDTQGEPIPDEPKIIGTMKIIHNLNGELNYITDDANEYDGPIGIELRGAYSQSLPQKPYGIETRQPNGLDSNVSILGMPEENDWVLIANYNDKSFVRNTLAFKIFSEMGNYATRMEFCEVVVNNKYQGIYLFGEKIKRDNGRVDIAKLGIDENNGDDVTGGYIFKTDYWNWDDSWLSEYNPIDHPEMDVRFVQYYPKPENITIEQEEYIEAYVDSFETALYSTIIIGEEFDYQTYIDVNSFIDYFLVNELSRNNDGFKKSRYYHKDKFSNGGKIKAGPVWDFDWAWKNINSCLFANTDGSGWAHHINDCNPDVNSPGWFIKLLEDPWFQDELKCRYESHRQNSMDSTLIFNYIDSIAVYLFEAQQRHYDKWPILGSSTGAPEVDPPALTFNEEIERLKDWISLRISWLDENIPGTCSLALNIEENDIESELSLYPNPTKGEFLLINLPDLYSEIRILDLKGRVLQKHVSSQREIQLNVSAYSSGVYIIQVIDSQGQMNFEKLIVE